jgi:hypothetical protein
MTRRHNPPKSPDEDDERPTRQTRHRQATGNRSGRILLAAGAVGLCAIATGVSLAAFSSSGGRAGTASDGHSPSAVTGQTAQPQVPAASHGGITAPGLTSAGIAKTALRWPSGHDHQMLVWKEGRGGIAWSAVTTQLGNAMQAGGVRLYPELRQACISLASSVATAQAAPPIPDGAMQRSYAKALSGLSGAATDCRSAISIRPEGDEGTKVTLNKTLLNRALAEFAAESKKLYTATAEIGTLHR